MKTLQDKAPGRGSTLSITAAYSGVTESSSEVFKIEERLTLGMRRMKNGRVGNCDEIGECCF